MTSNEAVASVKKTTKEITNCREALGNALQDHAGWSDKAKTHLKAAILALTDARIAAEDSITKS